MNIGLIGGSFDPVHTGHLVIAEAFAEQCSLNKCVFIPASKSPFKSEARASPDSRLAMLRLALADNDRFMIDDGEIKRGGASYTIDTLRQYADEFPASSLFLLAGEDIIEGFEYWREWRAILSVARLSIAPRPHSGKGANAYLGEAKAIINAKNYELNASCSARASRFELFRNRLALQGIADERLPLSVRTPLLEISSTDLRERFKAGRTTRYMLPDKVREYILTNNVYKV